MGETSSCSMMHSVRPIPILGKCIEKFADNFSHALENVTAFFTVIICSVTTLSFF